MFAYNTSEKNLYIEGEEDIDTYGRCLLRYLLVPRRSTF